MVKCRYEDCSKRASFGLLNTKISITCGEHKEIDFVNVVVKTCQHPNCLTLPIFGIKGTKIALFCKEHKEENHVDVKNQICQHSNCSTRSSFGIPGYTPEYCAKHKLPNMIIHPLKVKNEDYKQCEYCNLKIHYKQQFCTGCKSYNDLGITVKSHNKELAIKALLERNNILFKHDSIVDQGCSKRRPDFVIQKLNGCFIILEVDEFQHKRNTYSCDCEMVRMKQIFFDIGVGSVTFIRYNPDKYKVQKPKKEETNLEREDFLIRLIKTEMEKEINLSLSVVYLFYDYFDRQSYEFENIDPYLTE